MANNDQQPPWGKKPPQGPEDFIAQILDKLQDFFSDNKKDGSINDPKPGKSHSPRNPAGIIVVAILILGLAYGIFSSIFRINPSDVGVILRMGKYHTTVNPGLHLKLPYLDKLYPVNVKQVRKEDFGFSNRATSSSLTQEHNKESLMITADKNVINVAWIVQYRVGNPYAYLFFVSDVTQAIRDMSESVTRRIVGNMDFDYVLSNRDLLAAKVKEELQTMVDGLFPKGMSGVEIGTVQFKDINPPAPVKPAFNEVNEADQDMKRLVNEAQAEYNRVIPKARGNAKKIVEEAYGYKASRVNKAKGEAQRFLDILQAYNGAPEVTRQRMYLETMQQVLPGVKSIYVMDKNQKQAPIPLINLTETKVFPAQQTTKEMK